MTQSQQLTAGERSALISEGQGSQPATQAELTRLRALVATHGDFIVRTEIVPLSRNAFGRLIGGLPVSPESLVVLRAALAAR